MKGSDVNCIPAIGDHLVHECVLALFCERFIYEVVFYEAWPQNKNYNLTNDMVYFYDYEV